MKPSDIFITGRQLINDADEIDNADAILIKFVKEGQIHIMREYPSSRVKTDGTLLAIPLMSATVTVSTDLTLPDFYLTPMVEYFLWRFYENEKGDSYDSERAVSHQRNFLGFFTPRT